MAALHWRVSEGELGADSKKQRKAAAWARNGGVTIPDPNIHPLQINTNEECTLRKDSEDKEERELSKMQKTDLVLIIAGPSLFCSGIWSSYPENAPGVLLFRTCPFNTT